MSPLSAKVLPVGVDRAVVVDRPDEVALVPAALVVVASRGYQFPSDVPGVVLRARPFTISCAP